MADRQGPLEEGPMDINNPTDKVEVTEKEMIELGQFLENLRVLVLNHEARLGVLEGVIAEAIGLSKGADEQLSDDGNLNGSNRRVDADGEAAPEPVDGSESDDGGTETA